MMKVFESIVKTFRLVSDADNTKVKVVADPEHGTIGIRAGGGTATIYTHEEEAVANMILNAEMWNRENGAVDDQ